MSPFPNTLIVEPYLTLEPPAPKFVDFPTLMVPCVEDTDYAEGVKLGWESSAENLVIIEHDIFPTLNQLLEILDCPQPLCNCVYWSGPKHTGLEKPVIPHRMYIPGPFIELSNDIDFVRYSGLGFVKIKRFLRENNKVPIVHWQNLDVGISHSLALGPLWHLHKDMVVDHLQDGEPVDLENR